MSGGATQLHELLPLYVSGRLGEEFQGVVTGVTRFGMFVQIEGLPVEGLVGLEDLPEDMQS